MHMIIVIVLKLSWKMSNFFCCCPVLLHAINLNTEPTALNPDMITTDVQYHESILEVYLGIEVHDHVIKHDTPLYYIL